MLLSIVRGEKICAAIRPLALLLLYLSGSTWPTGKSLRRVLVEQERARRYTSCGGKRLWRLASGAGTSWLAWLQGRLSWHLIPATHADHPDDISIPDLDGELVVDAASLAEAADDFEHIIRRAPVAVLRPG